MKSRSRLWGSAVLFLLVGCADGAKLMQETEQGGIVVYPFKPETGAMVSSFRRDALRIIEERCDGHYHVVREGEAKGRSRVSTAVQGAEEIILDRRWGIQFDCR